MLEGDRLKVKSVKLYKSCSAKDIEIEDVDIPKAKENWVVVKVMAFGMNHSESLFRKFEIDNDFFEKPRVPGIECVGIIEESLDDNYKKGDKVIALMGGMGRSFDGSYQEYSLLPIKNVLTEWMGYVISAVAGVALLVAIFRLLGELMRPHVTFD